MTHSARLTNSPFGEWELYVVTDGLCQGWPTYKFHRIQPIPTLDERTAAMARLGYEAADEARWEWLEMDNGDAGDVALLAAFDVCPIGDSS
ncbi:DUF6303 family protein [Streptomyces sp. NPDC056387]|uniref:DUF6303 family protein n=1 Tax=unclassified Streptomyces TaxID=2593676 RepID=UPI0035DF3BA2